MKIVEKRIVELPDTIKECKKKIIKYFAEVSDYSKDELDYIRQIKTFDELLNYFEYDGIESIAEAFDAYPPIEERYIEK